MNRIFLIDYENVQSSGLDGIYDLSQPDAVYVLYTEHASRIPISFLDSILRKKPAATLNFMNVVSGNQALDLQLSAQLGYLIGKTNNKDTAFYIISRDNGFQALKSFWQSQAFIDIHVADNIAHALSSDATHDLHDVIEDSSVHTEDKHVSLFEVRPQRTCDNSSSSSFKLPTQNQLAFVNTANDKKAASSAGIVVEPKNKIKFNNHIFKLILNKGYSNDVAGKVASIACKYYQKKNRQTQIHSALQKQFGKKLGNTYFELIKNSL